VTVLDPDGVDAELSARQLGWERQGNELVKVLRRRDFVEALALVNAVGALAEEVNHHPDIDIRWNTVTLRLSTHSAGGITNADFELAAAIDELSAQR